MEKSELQHMFTYHPPKDEEQITRYNKIRKAALEFAEVIIDCTPKCADQTASIRKVREAAMTANSSIAIEESRKTFI